MTGPTSDTTQKSQTAEEELVSNMGNMAPFGQMPAYQGIQPSSKAPADQSSQTSQSKPASQSTYDDLNARISRIEAIIARHDEGPVSASAPKVTIANKMSDLPNSGSSGSGGSPSTGFGSASTPLVSCFGWSSIKGANVPGSGNTSGFGTRSTGFGNPSTQEHGFGSFYNGLRPSSNGFGSTGFGSPSTQGHGFGSLKGSASSGFGSPSTQGHGFGNKPFGSSSFGSSSTSGYSFGALKGAGSSCFGSPSPAENGFGSLKGSASSGFGSSSKSAHGFGSSHNDANTSNKPFGSSGFGSSSTRGIDSLQFGHGFGVDHQTTQGSSATGCGTKVKSSPTSATEDKHFGTRAKSAAPDISPPFGTTSTHKNASVSDNTSLPASGDESAPAPAQPSSNPANAYLLKAMEQVVVKSEGTIPGMKMLEILMQTHAGLVKAIEAAKVEGRDRAAGDIGEIL